MNKYKNKKYLLCIIDIPSRKVFIYLLNGMD